MTEEPGRVVRGRVVRIERTFQAPAEDVFDAWTSPEVMQRWFHCAPDWDTPEAVCRSDQPRSVGSITLQPDSTAGSNGLVRGLR